MISEGNKENGKLSPEEERRQKEDVYAVVSYCHDTITCRRVQVLRYFGEVYDAQGCHGGCNNCTHDGVVCEKDFTQLAHDAAALVKEILVSSTQPTTQNLLQDAFIGLNHKEIKRRGYVQFALHGTGKGMSREDVVRLFNKLLELSVLQYVSVANACGYHSTYVEVWLNLLLHLLCIGLIPSTQLGPKMDEFLKKRPTITLPVREENSASSGAPKKPRKATRPKEPKPMSKARKVAAIDVEEEAIGFYEDDDDSLQHLFPEDDAIEPPSPKKRPRAVPTAQRQGSPSRNGKGEDFPQASLEDGSWNSLYTELKVACYAVCGCHP
jgi:superfamily II DNA helicase RecQ